MSHVPDGMQRIGYDSDTHRFTFRDTAGNIYEGDEYGGELRLVERPSDKQGKSYERFDLSSVIVALTDALDNEPIRLFPTMPAAPANAGAKSTVSPTSFKEMLPAHLIAAAPPVAPPPRKSLNNLRNTAASSSPTHSRSNSGSKRSLWGVVRSATLPVKMRDVVDNVIRRPSVNKQQRREGDSDGYARLPNDERSRDSNPAPHSPSQHAFSHLRLPSRGHAKQRTE